MHESQIALIKWVYRDKIVIPYNWSHIMKFLSIVDKTLFCANICPDISRYTLFWLLLFFCKFAFSYFLQVWYFITVTWTDVRTTTVLLTLATLFMSFPRWNFWWSQLTQLWAFAMSNTNGMSFSPMVSLLLIHTLRVELSFWTLLKLNVSTRHAAEHNYGAVVSLWLPVILVKFS